MFVRHSARNSPFTHGSVRVASQCRQLTYTQKTRHCHCTTYISVLRHVWYSKMKNPQARASTIKRASALKYPTQTAKPKALANFRARYLPDSIFSNAQ